MLSILLLSLTASAFSPSSGTFIGQEPVRVRRYHIGRQHVLRRGAAWQSFLGDEGVGWLARFDERTGMPHRAWGPAIGLGPTPDIAAVETELRAFFARNADLLGIDPDSLKLGKHGYIQHRDTWLVDFDQAVDGVLVWRAGVTVRIRNGAIVMWGVNTVPAAAQIDTSPAIDAHEAGQRAMAMGPAGNTAHTDLQTQPMVLARDIDGQLDSRLVWEVRSKTEQPKGHWVSFVDASTGELLHVYNEVRFLSGTLSTEHDTRTVNGEVSVSPMPYFRVDDGDSPTYSDADGAWSYDSDTPVSGELRGHYVDIHNEGGSDAVFESLSGDVVVTDADASQAELSSYVFQHQIRDWAERYAPSLSMIHSQVEVFVNINDECNAYFDGSLNFMKAGGGCNNTARIADVNYHEWGHGFHYWNLVTGVFDGSISEGVSDIIAALNTGDAYVAPYFYTSGHAIREMESDRVYPDDWIGEVHYDGLIFAGAVWDLWGEMEEVMDPDDAYDAVSSLVVEAMRSGPEIPDAYDEFVLADDDNGDLSDGTPNLCAIVDAFARHGLGPGGTGTLVQVGHTPVENQPPDTAAALDADVVNLAPDCVELEIEQATVMYSTNGGVTWQNALLVLSGDTISGAIPGQTAGTVVQYYLSIDTPEGVATVPRGAAINPFTYVVGHLEPIYCEDFETDDGGYTHELVSGRDEEGADDWMWGTPQGLGGDPDFAFSGNNVWGNDLGGGQFNGEYQNDKHNRLISPVIDIGRHAEIVVQYRRWLNVEDGYYDQAIITANDETIWSNHESSGSAGDEHHKDEQWSLHSVPMSTDGSGFITLTWDIYSDRGLTMGGWNIDDVCIYALTDAPPGDDSDDGGGGIGGGGDGDEGTESGAANVGTDGPGLSGKGCACSATSNRLAGSLGWLAMIGVWGATRRRER
jgi:hypothetical protein